MNTKQMEYILELSRTKNFNRAAENLYISQPALTYQIKTVEDEIGFKIFERSGKGVYITPAGEQFTITIQNVLDELTFAINQGQNSENLYTKTVTVSLPIHTCLSRLSEAMKEQRKRNPSITITAKFTLPSQKTQAFHPPYADADITFVLHETAARLSGFREYPLYESRIYALVSPEDPLADKEVVDDQDLKDRTLAVYAGKYPFIMRRIHQQVHAIHPERLMLLHDVPSAFLGVESQSCIAILPGFLIVDTPRIRCIPCALSERIPCSLITANNEHRDSVISVIKLLQDIYKKNGEDVL